MIHWRGEPCRLQSGQSAGHRNASEESLPLFPGSIHSPLIWFHLFGSHFSFGDSFWWMGWSRAAVLLQSTASPPLRPTHCQFSLCHCFSAMDDLAPEDIFYVWSHCRLSQLGGECSWCLVCTGQGCWTPYNAQDSCQQQRIIRPQMSRVRGGETLPDVNDLILAHPSLLCPSVF